MYPSVQMPSIDSLPRPAGLRVTLGRWFVPQSFLRWTERTPERYLVKAPLAPALLMTSLGGGLPRDLHRARREAPVR